jgi:hypothetical protein
MKLNMLCREISCALQGGNNSPRERPGDHILNLLGSDIFLAKHLIGPEHTFENTDHSFKKRCELAEVLLTVLGGPRTGSELLGSLGPSGSRFLSRVSVSSCTKVFYVHRPVRGKYWWIFLEKLPWASEHVVFISFAPHTLSILILSQHPLA